MKDIKTASENKPIFCQVWNDKEAPQTADIVEAKDGKPRSYRYKDSDGLFWQYAREITS